MFALSEKTIRQRRNSYVFSTIIIAITYLDITISETSQVGAKISGLSNQKVIFVSSLILIHQLISFLWSAIEELFSWRLEFQKESSIDSSPERTIDVVSQVHSKLESINRNIESVVHNYNNNAGNEKGKLDITIRETEEVNGRISLELLNLNNIQSLVYSYNNFYRIVKISSSFRIWGIDIIFPALIGAWALFEMFYGPLCPSFSIQSFQCTVEGLELIRSPNLASSR